MRWERGCLKRVMIVKGTNNVVVTSKARMASMKDGSFYRVTKGINLMRMRWKGCCEKTERSCVHPRYLGKPPCNVYCSALNLWDFSCWQWEFRCRWFGRYGIVNTIRCCRANRRVIRRRRRRGTDGLEIRNALGWRASSAVMCVASLNVGVRWCGFLWMR